MIFLIVHLHETVQVWNHSRKAILWSSSLVSCSLWLEQHVPTSCWEEAAKRVKNKTAISHHEHMKKIKYEDPAAFGCVGCLGSSPIESDR